MTIKSDEDNYWEADLDPCDPANYWIDAETRERVNALTGERTQHECPLLHEEYAREDEL